LLRIRKLKTVESKRQLRWREEDATIGCRALTAAMEVVIRWIRSMVCFLSQNELIAESRPMRESENLQYLSANTLDAPGFSILTCIGT